MHKIVKIVQVKCCTKIYKLKFTFLFKTQMLYKLQTKYCTFDYDCAAAALNNSSHLSLLFSGPSPWLKIIEIKKPRPQKDDIKRDEIQR